MAKLKPVPTATTETAAAKQKSKMPLFAGIAGAVIVSVGLAGGGMWYWMHNQQAAAPKHEVKKAPVFVTLEAFTVNLLQEEGDHYLQVGIVYQVDNDKVGEEIKTYTPVMRNKILLLLSGKKPSEISQVEGKKKLVAELVAVARESLPEVGPADRGISGALLSAFVIQ